MKKRLMYVPRLSEFTNDDTGEIIKGGKIAITDVEPRYDDNGYGYYCELLWVSAEILSKLRNDPKARDLPQEIEIELENRGIKSKPRLVDISYIK